MNNKQRVYIMTLFLLWFAIGNICRQHLGMNIFATLFINSVLFPMGLAVPVTILWHYLGGEKIPYIDSPN